VSEQINAPEAQAAEPAVQEPAAEGPPRNNWDPWGIGSTHKAQSSYKTKPTLLAPLREKLRMTKNENLLNEAVRQFPDEADLIFDLFKKNEGFLHLDGILDPEIKTRLQKSFYSLLTNLTPEARKRFLMVLNRFSDDGRYRGKLLKSAISILFEVSFWPWKIRKVGGYY